MKIQKKWLGTQAVGRAQTLLSTFGFGTIGTASKLAYGAGIDSGLLLALRFLVAGAALWAYFLVFNRAAIRITRKQLATCAALGLAGYGIFSNLTFKAFETTPASVVGLLFFSYPVFVMILDWIVTRERPDLQLWVSALLILSGIAVGVVGASGGRWSVGMLLAVGGGAWYAAYVVAARRLLDNLKPQTVTLYVISFAALGFWLMGGPVYAHLNQVSRAWVVVLWIGLVSTVIALLSFFSGLEKLGSAASSQIGTFELVVSLSLAAFVLGERVGLPMVAGAAIMLAGMVTGQIKPSSRAEDCPDPC